jgi:hypothetical protein
MATSIQMYTNVGIDLLIDGYLTSSIQYFMHIQTENHFNNITKDFQ